MEDNNKRVLKNTMFLYIRQFVIMAMSFVSTRIVLETLGVENYGIYTVVGGFVGMFTILNSVLQSSTRRFIALAIGERDKIKTKNIFSTAMVIHIAIALIVVLALETIGLWFLNNKLNIEEQSLQAANWVFQFSILNVVITITQTPYVAATTANEKFNIYAIISIFDIGAKIAVLFLLILLPYNKLIVYAALMFSVSLCSSTIYRFYCIKRFEECRNISLRVDREIFKEMVVFSGWDSVGNIFSIANAQGVSIMLNMFFSTVINASRGLAISVTFTIDQFVSGFIQAAEPQLVKYYAQNDMVRFESLVFNVAQMTLFMLAIIAVPVWLEIDFVLKLWLGNIPEYTPEFIKITIFTCFISYSNQILVKANVAIGRVKEQSLYLLPILILHLPLVYIVLKQGWNPTSVYWVGSIPALLMSFVFLYILKRHINFPIRKYFFNLFLKNLLLVGIACIIPYIIGTYLTEGWLKFIVVCSTTVICNIILMWLFALNREVKQMVLQKLNLFHKQN